MNERTRRLFSQFFYEDPGQFKMMNQLKEQTSNQLDQDELRGNKSDRKLSERIEENKNQN